MTERFDYFLLMLWVMALLLGLVMVTSAVLPHSESASTLFGSATSYPKIYKHTVYLMLGVLAFLVALGVPIRTWMFFHKAALLLALVICVLVLIPGLGQVINGSRRWIGVGPITLQAAELTKFLAIVYLAGYIARSREHIKTELLGILRPVAIIGVVCVLLLFEPDFGTVVVLSLVTGGLLFLAGARLRYFLLLGGGATLALGFIAVVQPYRLERLTSFLDPWSVKNDSGYQLAQSLIAFGRGDVFGLGLGEGVQKLFYLPYAYNDFIFAVISEELGMTGGIAVLLLLTLLVLRIMRIARHAKDSQQIFAAFLAYGIGILIGVQAFVNIGVSIGMLPTKGLTLPFISFGGNSLLMSCLMMGIVFRVQIESSKEVRVG